MTSLFHRALRLGMEDENAPNVVQKEEELVFYGKIKDLKELEKASSVEHQEQYQIKIPKTEGNAVAGRIRIRKTVAKGGDPVYVLTIKTKTSEGAEIEVDVPANEKTFLQFQYLSEEGMIKDRYKFEAGPIAWELDMYMGPNGRYQEWCRLELEVQEFSGAIPNFPIALDEIITNQDGQRTPEEEAKVRTLFDTVFITPNPFK